MLKPARVRAQRSIHRDRYSYCAHPQVIVKRDGGMAMVFNRGPRREQIMHPPQDPLFMNVVSRSADDGVTWSGARVVPDYRWTGTETASLTELPDGSIMLNQWRGRWLPLRPGANHAGPEIHHLPRKPHEILDLSEEFAGAHAKRPAESLRALGCRQAKDVCALFEPTARSRFPPLSRLRRRPLSGATANRGAIVLPRAKIILPLSDVYNFATVFVVESVDNGRTWSAPAHHRPGSRKRVRRAGSSRHRSGKIVIVLRDNGRRLLHQIESAEEGETWSDAQGAADQGLSGPSAAAG